MINKNLTISTQLLLAKELASLLQNKLPIITKYWITNLYKVVNDEKVSIETLTNELIKKYGTQNGDDFEVKQFILDEEGNEVVNPNYSNLNKEYKELLKVSKDVSVFEFKFEHFVTKDSPYGIEIDENFPIFYSLINESID